MIVAVYVVDEARLADGVKVAVVPLYITVPITPPTVNVAVVTVAASIVSLNVAVIVVFTATPVALFDGLVDETVGDVVSAILLNVAVQVLSASIVTCPSVQSTSPLHPAKVELTSGVAVMVTCVPEV